jgi:hypothetical protein
LIVQIKKSSKRQTIRERERDWVVVEQVTEREKRSEDGGRLMQALGVVRAPQKNAKLFF